jgi:hypothetical protein
MGGPHDDEGPRPLKRIAFDLWGTQVSAEEAEAYVTFDDLRTPVR